MYSYNSYNFGDAVNSVSYSILAPNLKNSTFFANCHAIATKKRHFLPFFCLWLYFLDISVQKRPLKPIFFGKLVKFPIICHQKHVHTTKLLSTRLFLQKWNFTGPIPQTVSYHHKNITKCIYRYRYVHT